MKKIIRYSLAFKSVLLITICTLFSFTERDGLGGDSYSIHLNDKLILQHYVFSDKKVEPITLSERSANDVISIRYSHCGKIGTSRTIALTDDGKKILKQVQFPDATGETALSMSMKVKDILAVRRGSANKKVNLYYRAKELEDGMVLATLVIGDDTKASLK